MRPFLLLKYLSGNDSWYPLTEEAKIEVDPISSADDPPAEWEEWMNRATAALLDRTLKLMEVPLPKKMKIKPYFNLSNSSAQLRQIEMRHFQELDGIMLMRSYCLSAQGTLSCQRH
jgi:hypothetical protein